MRCRLVILAIVALLSRPVAQCLPRLEPISPEVEDEEHTSTLDVSASAEDDEPTEQTGSPNKDSAQPHSSARMRSSQRCTAKVQKCAWRGHYTNAACRGTSTLVPGSPCRRETDCAGDMVCLPSGTCGCSKLSPLLLSYADSFACVSPRRLNEPCLGHAQCSHENKRALCLSSVCRCPSQFRANVDMSQCLPVTATFNLFRTAMLPAVLLILGFAGLAVLSYRRLYKTSGDKARDLHGPCFPLSNASCPAYVMPLGKSANVSRESGSDNGLTFGIAWSRLHSFAENTTLGLKSTKRRCQWPLPDSNTSCAMTREEEPAEFPRLCSPKYAGTRRQISSSCFAEPSVVANWLASRGPFDLTSIQNVPSAYSPPPTSTLESAYPVPMRRTRVSTLSTSTLMPPRRANRRSSFNSTVSSPPGAFTYRNRQGFWQSGMSSLRETDAETNESGNAETFLRVPPSFVRFTASELRAAPPKKFISEKVGISPVKNMRRTVSDLGGTLEAAPQERTQDSPRYYPGWPSVHFCGPTDESLCTFGWRTESYVNLLVDEDSDHGGISTRSQPAWPYQHVAWKGTDRKARMCEAFTFHQARMGSKQVGRPKQPWIAKESRNCSPASGDFSPSRRGAMTESVASNAEQYSASWSSVSNAESVALSNCCAQCSCEPQSSRVTKCGTSPLGRRFRQPRNKETWPRWSGSAQTQYSAFGERALVLGKPSSSVSSNGTTSLAPTASTNLPLSLCTLHSGRTESSRYSEWPSSDN